MAQPTWVITGPTAGIGRRTAVELAKQGTVVLVGRNRGRLEEVENQIHLTDPATVTAYTDYINTLIDTYT